MMGIGNRESIAEGSEPPEQEITTVREANSVLQTLKGDGTDFMGFATKEDLIKGANLHRAGVHGDLIAEAIRTGEFDKADEYKRLLDNGLPYTQINLLFGLKPPKDWITY